MVKIGGFGERGGTRESKIKDYLLGFTIESDFKPPARLRNCLRLANMQLLFDAWKTSSMVGRLNFILLAEKPRDFGVTDFETL